jgi:hypothetical protein
MQAFVIYTLKKPMNRAREALFFLALKPQQNAE